ncbi:MAG TPA: carboxypeptidase-like regulatory domain-containing protein, partial [Actinotalea sp.]
MRSDRERRGARALAVVVLALMTVVGGAWLPDVAVAEPVGTAAEPTPAPTPTDPTSDPSAPAATQDVAPTTAPTPPDITPAPELGTTPAPELATPPTPTAPAAAAPAPAALSATTASITGQVLSQMDPIGGATVTVLAAATGRVLSWTVADGDGQYRIDNLAPGAVKVRATKTGYLPSFSNGRTTLATADVFTLQAGVTLSQSWDPAVLYLDLMPEAVVQGQVLSWMDPIGGATVTVLDAVTGKVLGSAVSDVSGDYRIGMLPAGHVKVRGSKPGCLTSFADS